MAPSVLLAPAIFSTTNGWPSRSWRNCDSALATTSVRPPGGAATTMRTDLAGYCCAPATPIKEYNARAANNPRPHARRFLKFVRRFGVWLANTLHLPIHLERFHFTALSF